MLADEDSAARALEAALDAAQRRGGPLASSADAAARAFWLPRIAGRPLLALGSLPASPPAVFASLAGPRIGGLAVAGATLRARIVGRAHVCETFDTALGCCRRTTRLDTGALDSCAGQPAYAFWIAEKKRNRATRAAAPPAAVSVSAGAVPAVPTVSAVPAVPVPVVPTVSVSPAVSAPPTVSNPAVWPARPPDYAIYARAGMLCDCRGLWVSAAALSPFIELIREHAPGLLYSGAKDLIMILLPLTDQLEQSRGACS